MKTSTLISWNVNGLRSAAKKGFLDWLAVGQYDLVALQEVKVLDLSVLKPELRVPPGYASFWHPADRPGYSGVMVYVKEKPATVKIDFGGGAILSAEGRVIELDLGDFVFLNVYFPNGKSRPERLKYKLEFYDAFLNYVSQLARNGRSVIFCGDVNTAHQEIDLTRPKENAKISGFLPEERAWLDRVIESGFVDTFRLFHSEPNQYSWWDVKTHARERNVGWRIDYFFASHNLRSRLIDAFILPEVTGSDHCPVGLTLKR